MKKDGHGEQIDKRPNTSWSASLPEINPMEMLETQLINVTAPFIIVTQLTPLLCNNKYSNRKFIINVTSSEGQFHTPLPKKGFHPHTNMAKAALNMLTRTTAVDFARDNVFIVSVDPGWVSDMRPYGEPPTVSGNKTKGVKTRLTNKPPLTEEDGAARVLDVIFGYEGRTPPYGVLLKHYQVDSW